MKKSLVAGLSLLIAGMMSSCGPNSEDHPVQLQGAAQGTYYNMLYFDVAHRDFHKQVDSILTAFNHSVSTWD